MAEERDDSGAKLMTEKRQEKNDSDTETDDIKSYRRDVVHVFNSYLATLSSVIRGETLKSFADKVFTAHLITSQTMEFTNIFDQFKAGLELCGSVLEIQERCKCLSDIFVDLGGPLGDAGKEIEAKLNLTVSCQEVTIPNELQSTQENTQLMWQPHSELLANVMEEVNNAEDLKLITEKLRREFDELVVKVESILRTKNIGDSTKQIYLSPTYKYQFDQMRVVFGNFLDTVVPLINTHFIFRYASLDEWKKYLQRCFCELKPQLSIAKSFNDVKDIVQDKCTIINIIYLEAIINHYKIESANPHIVAYKTEVDQFCKELKISICENKDFMTRPSTLLKCETIEFILEWKTDEHTLSEIQGLLWKAFGDMAKRVSVRVIKEGGYTKQIYLSRTFQFDYDMMRMNFGKFIDTVAPLIANEIPSLQELKTFLRRCLRELKPQLSVAESFDDVMEIVHDKCTVANITCLEGIVDHYNIKEAKGHIEAYKRNVDYFCERIKMNICLNEDFTTFPSTLMTTIEFILEWKTDEHTLSDIKNLLSKAFKKLAKRVLVRAINEGN